MAFIGFNNNDTDNTNIDTHKYKLVKLDPLVCTPLDACHQSSLAVHSCVRHAFNYIKVTNLCNYIIIQETVILFY